MAWDLETLRAEILDEFDGDLDIAELHGESRWAAIRTRPRPEGYGRKEYWKHPQYRKEQALKSYYRNSDRERERKRAIYAADPTAHREARARALRLRGLHYIVFSPCPGCGKAVKTSFPRGRGRRILYCVHCRLGP